MTEHPTYIYSEIHILAAMFERTFKQGDAAGVADFYTANGTLLPTGQDFVRGKHNIKEFWQGAMNMGISNAKLNIKEIEQHGDTAIEVSTYTLSDSDDQVIDQGKGMVIWKYEDGSWKIHRDIWNSSLAEQ